MDYCNLKCIMYTILGCIWKGQYDIVLSIFILLHSINLFKLNKVYKYIIGLLHISFIYVYRKFNKIIIYMNFKQKVSVTIKL